MVFRFLESWLGLSRWLGECQFQHDKYVMRFGSSFFKGKFFAAVFLPQDLELLDGLGWELAHARSMSFFVSTVENGGVEENAMFSTGNQPMNYIAVYPLSVEAGNLSPVFSSFMAPAVIASAEGRELSTLAR